MKDTESLQDFRQFIKEKGFFRVTVFETEETGTEYFEMWVRLKSGALLIQVFTDDNGFEVWGLLSPENSVESVKKAIEDLVK